MTETHIPVLLQEMLHTLAPQDGCTYIDATFGGGGYTDAILNTANCKVIAIDRDPDAQKRALPFENKYKDRFQFISGTFSELDTLLPKDSLCDGIVFDFGMSSFQLDEADRGFSFRLNGPLDMRMSKDFGLTAADVVNTYSAEELAEIIWFYGDEKKSRIIARAIVEQRKIKPFETTIELAQLVRKFVKRHDGLDPATLTFQALRIFVNNELIEIDTVLKKTLSHLSAGGKVVAVSFHALEDRLIKNWIRSDHSALQHSGYTLKALFSKPICPSDEEVRKNPRSRSAKLRAVQLISTKTIWSGS